MMPKVDDPLIGGLIGANGVDDWFYKSFHYNKDVQIYIWYLWIPLDT